MAINRIALATRKGLLLLESGKNGNWLVQHEAFAGSHVSIVFLDQRNGNMYACLDDGHFGNKVFRWSGFLNESAWREADPEQSWKEIAVPKYPDGSKRQRRGHEILVGHVDGICKPKRPVVSRHRTWWLVCQQ